MCGKSSAVVDKHCKERKICFVIIDVCMCIYECTSHGVHKSCKVILIFPFYLEKTVAHDGGILYLSIFSK